jgi:hypothetical protein
MKRLSYIMILIIFVILLAGGLAMSVFAQSIETALTVPTRLSSSPGATASPARASTRAAATPHAGVTPVVTSPPATATPVAMNAILAQDTFQRADQLFWGTASDGQVWNGDAATQKAFSIAGQMGQIGRSNGFFNATLGPMVANTEIQFSGSLSQFRQSNMGAVLRFTDANDCYKAYIDGTDLVILKRLAAIGTRLGAIPFKALAGVTYTLRFRAIGSTLSAKVWPSNQAEPTSWMVTVTDASFQSGFGGLRVLIGTNTVVHIATFRETTVMGTA